VQSEPSLIRIARDHTLAGERLVSKRVGAVADAELVDAPHPLIAF